MKALVDFQHNFFLLQYFRKFSRVVSIHKTMHFDLFVKLQWKRPAIAKREGMTKQKFKCDGHWQRCTV